MPLDARGKISIVELLVYVPLHFLTLFLVFRHGFKRIGYIYLLLLSIMRIVGAATHIASEQSKTPNVALHIIFSIMESTGVAQLLLAAQSFISTVKEIGFEQEYRLHTSFRLLGLMTHIALLLTVVGGVMAAPNTTNLNKAQHGINIKHVGVILFLIAYLSMLVTTAFLWSNRQRVMRHRRTLLLAITASLPFLAVRLLYSILSAYAPSGIPDLHSGDRNLSAFNSVTGNVAAYLIMSVIMEIIVVVITLSVAVMLPLGNDYGESAGRQGDDGFKLAARTTYSAPSYLPPSNTDSSTSIPKY